MVIKPKKLNLVQIMAYYNQDRTS